MPPRKDGEFRTLPTARDERGACEQPAARDSAVLYSSLHIPQLVASPLAPATADGADTRSREHICR